MGLILRPPTMLLEPRSRRALSMASFELTLRTRWLRERGAPTLPGDDAGRGAVTERGAGRRGGTTASPPRTLGAGRAVVVGRVAGLPAELGRGEEPVDQPREGEPIGRVVGVGRLVTGRVLLGREVVLGRVTVGHDVVGRLMDPGRVIVGRLVPVERGREVVGRVMGRVVDGRLVGRVVEGRLVGREVLGRDCGLVCGLETGRDGRLVGRDGRLVGRL